MTYNERSGIVALHKASRVSIQYYSISNVFFSLKTILFAILLRAALAFSKDFTRAWPSHQLVDEHQSPSTKHTMWDCWLRPAAGFWSVRQVSERSELCARMWIKGDANKSNIIFAVHHRVVCTSANATHIVLSAISLWHPSSILMHAHLRCLCDLVRCIMQIWSFGHIGPSDPGGLWIHSTSATWIQYGVKEL